MNYIYKACLFTSNPLKNGELVGCHRSLKDILTNNKNRASQLLKQSKV